MNHIGGYVTWAVMALWLPRLNQGNEHKMTRVETGSRVISMILEGKPVEVDR